MPRNYRLHREEMLDYNRRYCRRIKLQAFQKISGLEKPICHHCGCDDLRLLEVNHLNGRPEEEKDQSKAGHWIQLEIVKGRRAITDLEVACRVCNAKDYVEKKYQVKYEVKFQGKA